MNADEAPWEVRRQRAHWQQMYGQGIVKEVADLFGNDSAEYGLALAGSPQLPKLLEKHNHRFTPEAILHVSEDTQHAQGIVDVAKRHIAIAELKKRAEVAVLRNKEPEWFKN